MPVIEFAADWNKPVKLDQGLGKLVENHESSLSQDEMTALVLAVLDIPGMGELPAEMPEPIKALAERLASKDGRVQVQKGIHQRDSDVHFTIALLPLTAGGYHIWLKAGGDVVVNTGPVKWGAPSAKGKVAHRNLFKYQPTGLSFLEGKAKVEHKWPAMFVVSKGNMPLGRPRGQSFSVGNSTTVAQTTPKVGEELFAV